MTMAAMILGAHLGYNVIGEWVVRRLEYRLEAKAVRP